MAKKKKVYSEEPEETFHVEVITKARVCEDDEGWEYYVKWAGYDSDANSWEPAENVAGCDRLLNSFWLHVGTDNKDYKHGYEVAAQPAWIEKEKKYFAEHFGKEEKTKDKSKPKRAKEPERLKGKAVPFKTKASSSRGSSKQWKDSQSFTISSDDSDSDNLPLVRKKRRKPSVISDSDAESSDAPLRKARKIVPSTSKIKNKESKDKKVITKNQNKFMKEPSKTKSEASTSSIGKGKGKERASPAPPPPSSLIHELPNSPAHSLFSGPSAPSSPDVSLSKPLPPESNQPSNNKAPTSKPIPSHRTQPKIKMMDFPTSNMKTGTAISTKQRITQASSFAGPSAVSQSTNPQKKMLSKLTFKKGSSGGSLQTPLDASPNSPQLPSASSSRPPDMDVVQSPTSIGGWDQMAVDDEPFLPDQYVPSPEPHLDLRRQEMSLPRRQSTQFSQKSPINPLSDAEQFLSSIMPEGLAAPMHETTGEEETPVSAPARKTTAAPRIVKQGTIGRIPKRWKWSGDLYIETGPDKAELMCKISLSEPTDPRPNGLRLSICVSSTVDSLRLKKLYDFMDIYNLLSACAPVQQVCKLGPEEDKDAQTIDTLRTYMFEKRLFTYAKMYLDNDPVGFLIVFPSRISTGCDLFKVPQDVRESNCLVAALVPYTLSMDESQRNTWLKSKAGSSSEEPLLDPAYGPEMRISGRKLVANPLYHRGLRVLKFPQAMHKYMSQPNRPYCIWYTPSDGQPHRPGFETSCLKAILDVCRAKDVGYKTDVRAIFIHIGALKTLSEVGVIALRRAKRPEIRFFTYGTHHTVSPERWGFREIYPLGGIVTFAPTAILEDPIGVYRLIEKIEEHPLWSCFILPSVIGAVAKLSTQNLDPIALFDKDELFFSPILELVEDGKLSLLSAPPEIPVRQKQDVNGEWDDPAMKWITGQLESLSMKARDYLELCLHSFRKGYANVESSDVPAAVGKDVITEMRQMQYQPALMDQYRRFVIIKGTNDPLADVSAHEMNECLKLSEFDFKDDYFPKQSQNVHSM